MRTIQAHVALYLFILSLFLPVTSIAADSTSYAPVGAASNISLDMHGKPVNGASSYYLSNGNYWTTNGGVWNDNLIYSQSGYTYTFKHDGTPGTYAAGAFVDHDNSSYYVDPNGTTVLNAVYVYGGTTNANHAATKSYVDSAVATAAKYDWASKCYYQQAWFGVAVQSNTCAPGHWLVSATLSDEGNSPDIAAWGGGYGGYIAHSGSGGSFSLIMCCSP